MGWLLAPILFRTKKNAVVTLQLDLTCRNANSDQIFFLFKIEDPAARFGIILFCRCCFFSFS